MSKVSQKIKNLSIIIIKLVLSLIAVYLSWGCNKSSHILLRLFLAILVFIFSEFYIIYYSIYRVALGNKCIGSGLSY